MSGLAQRLHSMLQLHALLEYRAWVDLAVRALERPADTRHFRLSWRGRNAQQLEHMTSSQRWAVRHLIWGPRSGSDDETDLVPSPPASEPDPGIACPPQQAEEAPEPQGLFKELAKRLQGLQPRAQELVAWGTSAERRAAEVATGDAQACIRLVRDLSREFYDNFRDRGPALDSQCLLAAAEELRGHLGASLDLDDRIYVPKSPYEPELHVWEGDPSEDLSIEPVSFGVRLGRSDGSDSPVKFTAQVRAPRGPRRRRD